MKIEDAIKTKVIYDPFVKASINIEYTSSWLGTIHNEVMAPYDFSMQQYNILRILKGQFPKAVTVKFLIERMVDKNSNASRLVDKLCNKKLIDRSQCEVDRRQVDVKINERGLEMLEELTKKLEVQFTKFKSLTDKEYEQLSNLLDKMRG